jgi:hypothetical protein
MIAKITILNFLIQYQRFEIDQVSIKNKRKFKEKHKLVSFPIKNK